MVAGQRRASLALLLGDAGFRIWGVIEGGWTMPAFRWQLDSGNALYVAIAGVLVWVAWVLNGDQPRALARQWAAAGIVTALFLTRDLLCWGLWEGALWWLLFMDTGGAKEEGNHPVKALLLLMGGLWWTMAGSWFLHAWDNRHSYDWGKLAATPVLTEVAPWIQGAVFGCLALGMATKLTLFPWHRWLWGIAGEPGARLMWAVWLPLIGAFGLIEVVGRLFPDGLVRISGWLVAWALVNAWVAVAQSGGDSDGGRRLLGVTMGQMSLLLLGLALGGDHRILGLWVLSFALMVALLGVSWFKRDKWGTIGASLALMGVPGLSGAAVWWAVASVALMHHPVWAILTLVAVWLSAGGLLTHAAQAEGGGDPSARWLTAVLLGVSVLAGMAPDPLADWWGGGR